MWVEYQNTQIEINKLFEFSVTDRKRYKVLSYDCLGESHIRMITIINDLGNKASYPFGYFIDVTNNVRDERLNEILK